MSPPILRLIDVLAVAEVADYMTAQAATGNDHGRQRSERPASDDAQQAA